MIIGGMRETLKRQIIEVCDKKIDSKGENVGLSFYAFFANKNDDPELLMEAAKWGSMSFPVELDNGYHVGYRHEQRVS